MNCFYYNEDNKILNVFEKRDIQCKIKKNKNKDYYLEFDVKNTELLIILINKYINCSFFFKFKKYLNIFETSYEWNSEYLESGTLRVSNIEYIQNSYGNVYDIEVADNHNFVIGQVKNKMIDGPIVSNCHHTPGRCFSKIFYKIGSKYNLGLSATLTRADGLTKVIKYFLGDTIVNLKLSTFIPKILTYYTSIDPLREKTMINGKINIPGMINDLVESYQRNLEIINILKEKYLENRKILVLTDRRGHCSELKRLLGDEYSIGLYLGGMKNDKLQESNTKRIIIATYNMASEGYDNPELDTLVFATPKSKIEQAVGRILRQENKNSAEVIDIVDTFSIFNNFYYARNRFYKSKKYLIERYSKDTEDSSTVQEIEENKEYLFYENY